MKAPWPKVRLGEVLTQYIEYIETPGPRLYPKLSVKLYGRGVTLDTPVDGTFLKMKRHQLAKAGQVILSEIWGKKGAIGFVPSEGEGALCTSHFFLFDVNEARLDRRWLRSLFTANYLEEQLGVEAKGTTGYAAVRPKTLLECEIPLPLLTEQRRMVERIEELTAKINEARALRQQAAEEAETICRAIFASSREPATVPMRELVRLRQPDTRVQPDEVYQFAGVYSFGRGVFRSHTRIGMEFAYPRLTRLRTGNFVYPKLMAWEGALGIVPAECDGCVVSTEFPVFEVIEERVLPEVLDTYFRTPAVWPEISGASTGTNVRRRRLNPEDFLNYQMPMPPRRTQELLRIVRRKIAVLGSLQTEASVEMDLLRSAVLHYAFNGRF